MQNKFKTLIWVFLFLAISPEAGAQESAGDCYEMEEIACAVFHETNDRREQQGLPRMQYCQNCFLMAQDHSDDMFARGYFSHNRPAHPGQPAETFTQRSKRFGLRNWVGENIARNPNPQNVVSRWMNSPGHRRNILNPRYNSFAVGYREGLFTQVFWQTAE